MVTWRREFYLPVKMLFVDTGELLSLYGHVMSFQSHISIYCDQITWKCEFYLLEKILFSWHLHEHVISYVCNIIHCGQRENERTNSLALRSFVAYLLVGLWSSLTVW